MDFAALVLGLELLALSDVDLTRAEHPAAGMLRARELTDEMFEADALVTTDTGAVAELRVERLLIALILHPDDASARLITDSPRDHGQPYGHVKPFHEPIHDADPGHRCLLVALV